MKKIIQISFIVIHILSFKVLFSVFAEEPDKTKINKIIITGAKHFSQQKLLKLLKITPGKFFDEDELKSGLSSIIDFYKNNGFAKVEIHMEKSYTDLSMQEVDLVIEINEGKRYNINKISFVGNKVFSSKKLLKVTKLHRYSPLIAKKIEHALERLVELYYSKTGVSPRIEPNIIYNDVSATADVIFNITEFGDYEEIIKIEKENYYVSKVFIEGISEPDDRIISYELNYLLSGKKFNHQLTMKALRRINSVYGMKKIEGYTLSFSLFSTLFNIPAINIHIFAKDNLPKMLNSGFLYRPWYGFGLHGSIEHNNLFHKRHQAKFEVKIGQRWKETLLTYKTRWNFGLPVRISYFAGYGDKNYCYYENTFCDEFKTVTFPKFGLGIYYKFFPIDISFDILYSIERKYLQEVDTDYLRQRQAKHTINRIALEVEYDYYFSPYSQEVIFEGIETGIKTGIAGGVLGGDVKYYDFSLWFKAGLPITVFDSSIIFDFNGCYAGSYGEDKEVPIYARYFPGGLTEVSGYDFWGQIGPPEGGNIKIIGSVKLPIPVVKKYLLFLTPFFEFGNAWRRFSDIDWSFSVKDNSLKRSAGISFGFPVLAIQYSKGLDAKPEEKSDYFYFIASTVW
ncbi:MAG: BamA/TamA family outer membrane protein [Endomicrobia bacterium]|nr:BamA/TamA family outer membrane protein [Endomicrobiia bacterium]